MKRYLCNDGNAEIEIAADSAREAAQQYVDGGDWGVNQETDWVDVYVQEIDEDGEEVGDRQCIKIAIEPDEPECSDGNEHDWQSPHSLLGGIEENPGVWGHGGGVIITEVCVHCGIYRDTDTWAQDMSTGEQGLRSINYRDADEASEEWV